MRNRVACSVAVALLWCASAEAALVVDQEQSTVLADMSVVYAVGGSSNQVLAQTVTAGMTGNLAAIELPIGCQDGTLVIEIVSLSGDVPGTTVLGSVSVPSAEIPESEWRRFELDRPIRMSAGDRFAIVLRNPTGACGWRRAPEGDLYTGGEGYFFNNTPGTTEPWVLIGFIPGETDDMPFRTLIDRPSGGGGGSSGLCTVNGLAIPHVPSWAPVCRCLVDEGLREQRCALLHPSLMLFRRIPFPTPAAGPFKVQWTLVLFEKLQGVVEVSENLGKAPLTFFVDQLAPGMSQTLSYDGSVAAAKRNGPVKVETGITLMRQGQESSGVMSTKIE